MQEITVMLDAANPDSLLLDPTPHGVYLRCESTLGHCGVAVSIRGPIDAVFGFVRMHWGDEEADRRMLARLVERGLHERGEILRDPSAIHYVADTLYESGVRVQS